MGKIDEYEEIYPEVGISDAQKQERMERIELKRKQAGGAAGKYFVIPEMPWKETDDEPDSEAD